MAALSPGGAWAEEPGVDRGLERRRSGHLRSRYASELSAAFGYPLSLAAVGTSWSGYPACRHCLELVLMEYYWISAPMESAV